MDEQDMQLDDLILRRKTELGLTYEQLGERALAAGAPTAPNFHHLATTRLVEFPRRRTIEPLAAALEVDVETVVVCMLNSLGLHLRRVGHGSEDRSSAVIRTGVKTLIVSTVDLPPEGVSVLSQRIRKITSDVAAEYRSTRDTDPRIG